MLLFGSIIILIVGLIMVISPTAFYNLTESWKNNSDSEPSDLYKISVRIGGIFSLIVSILGIIVFFID